MSAKPDPEKMLRKIRKDMGLLPDKAAMGRLRSTGMLPAADDLRAEAFLVPCPRPEKLSLHLNPDLIEMIDYLRGPASRETYAVLALEWTLKQRCNDGGKARRAAEVAMMELAAGETIDQLLPRPSADPEGTG